MKQFNSSFTFCLIVYLTFNCFRGEVQAKAEGSLWDSFVPKSLSNIWKLTDLVNFTDNGPISDVLMHFIEKFRDGLIDEGGHDLPFPDFDWPINGNNLKGMIHTYNMGLAGISEFKMKQLAISVLNQTLDLNLRVPVVDLHGDYIFDGFTAMGVPIWGTGGFSIKLHNLGISLGAQLIGPSSSIKVYDPVISLDKIAISLDGFLSDIQLWHLIIMSVLIITSTVAISVFFTLHFCSGMGHKIIRRNSSYRAVL